MGRPLSKKYFGSDDATEAVATYSTDGNAVTADGTVNDPGEITITVSDGGSGYSGNFTVTVTDAGGGTFDADFVVSSGVVQSGSASNLSGTINDGQSGVSIDMPVPGGENQFQILGFARFTGQGAAEECFIRRQRSNRKFDVEAVASSDRREVCITVDGPTGIEEGQMYIPVEPSDGAGGSTGTEYARIIQGHRVKTFDDNSYKWGELNADETGEALPGTDTPG